jgi:cytochrome c oxidase subunit 4
MADHSAHAATAKAAHGGHGHTPEEVAKEVRKYLLVFAALMVGTILTVWASYIHFGSDWMNIVVALIIAIVKASLVAGFFMHLVDEKKLIYGLLGATVFFFVGLMYLTLWSLEPGSLIHLKSVLRCLVMARIFRADGNADARGVWPLVHRGVWRTARLRAIFPQETEAH